MSHITSPTHTSSLSEWQQYLESLHAQKIDLGLERVALVAKKGNLTKPAPKVITVAGTNGKGSTCAILESILLAAGFKTGVYSSPHLIKYNERVRINGAELDDTLHTRAFAEIETIRENVSLSFFEFGTLAALWLFIEHKVDVVILEVGLGGRLDATNVVEHDVSVITSLAIDHVDWLGNDLNQIGYEKAGIFRSDKPAICGQPSPPSSVSAYADEIGAKLYQIGYHYQYVVTDSDHWHWRSGVFDLPELPIPNLPLQNAATAIMALGASELDIADVDIVAGLKNVHLSGRMEKVSDSPLILMDVAHNPHSANYLALQINKMKRKYSGDVHAIVGMLYDKDIEGTLSEMQLLVDHWHPVTLDVQRGAKGESLSRFLGSEIHYESPVHAFDKVKTSLDSEDILIVFGSFHTVGQISEHVKTWRRSDD